MAHLSRSKKREEIAEDDATMMLLDEYNYTVGVTWVFELLSKHSDDLIVLHSEEAIGVRVRYENLSNCFHLFTLLQETLADVMPHDVDEDEDLEEDEDDEDDGFSDYAWWHYGQGNIPVAGIESTIWGEMSPKSISIVDGVQVLVLWPQIMASRSWDDGFFHPRLEAAPAGVESLEVLSDEDVATWRKRLELG